jgi:hypothetical protein
VATVCDRYDVPPPVLEVSQSVLIAPVQLCVGVPVADSPTLNVSPVVEVAVTV